MVHEARKVRLIGIAVRFRGFVGWAKRSVPTNFCAPRSL